mmetsp:Transcript_2103/g.4816  ORF Transcript_2103/g.4816 Transcript_2103/m.4816 type:complete len:218 (+) Transcript_2103:609-1262(+)
MVAIAFLGPAGLGALPFAERDSRHEVNGLVHCRDLCVQGLVENDGLLLGLLELFRLQTGVWILLIFPLQHSQLRCNTAEWQPVRLDVRDHHHFTLGVKREVFALGLSCQTIEFLMGHELRFFLLQRKTRELLLCLNLLAEHVIWIFDHWLVPLAAFFLDKARGKISGILLVLFFLLLLSLQGTQTLQCPSALHGAVVHRARRAWSLIHELFGHVCLC